MLGIPVRDEAVLLPPVSPGQDLTLHDFTKHLEAFLQLAGAHAAGEVSDVHHPAFPDGLFPPLLQLAPVPAPALTLLAVLTPEGASAGR